MKFHIQDRDLIEIISRKPFPKGTAVISIADVGSEFAELWYDPDELLQLRFDDYEPINALTDEQAKEIAEFYHRVSKTVKRIVCQCEHNKARSAAIVAAIKEYSEGNGIEIFADDRYFPDKVVFRKVLEALKERELKC